MQNPFKRARPDDFFIRVLLWGDPGTGKTTTALTFPSPVVLDIEGKDSIYATNYNFDFKRCKTSDEIFESVKWLSKNKHDYKTLVIDGATTYNHLVRKKWSEILHRTKKNKAGYNEDYYEFQPNDWSLIKNDIKRFVDLITQIPMHVVITAESKPSYDNGFFAGETGKTFDIEKSIAYKVHFELQLVIYNKKHCYICHKQDQNIFEKFKPIEFEQKDLVEKFLYKQPVKVNGKRELISFDFKEGQQEENKITENQIKKIELFFKKIKLSKDMQEKGLAKFGCKNLIELTQEQADKIIQRIGKQKGE